MEEAAIVVLYRDRKLSYREIGKLAGMPYWVVRRIVVAAGCSRSRRTCKAGALNPSWHGGRYRDGQGYWRVHRPEHPQADTNGYVKEHRLLMEQQIGRPLKRREHVHHRDGDRGNNDPANLALLSDTEHLRLHNPHGPVVPYRGGGVPGRKWRKKAA